VREHKLVQVCTNKACRARGSEFLLGLFQAFKDDSYSIQRSGCLGRCSAGPHVRVETERAVPGAPQRVNRAGVEDVECAVDILTHELGVDLTPSTVQCLKLNFLGNSHLSAHRVDEAIGCYTEALALREEEQQGVLLLMRGMAFLQKAYAARLLVRDMLVDTEAQQRRLRAAAMALVATASAERAAPAVTAAAVAAWRRAYDEGALDAAGRKARLEASVYEVNLLSAADDLLRATLEMPSFAKAWRQAGQALVELGQLDTAVQYYECALRLDPSLAGELLPTIERVRVKQQVSARARQLGLPEETIAQLLEG